ncbi:MAG: class I SAM-dependent methyltransferase [Candidatus Odinarchaeota archaeon]
MNTGASPSENNQIESILKKLHSISSKNALDVATGDGGFIRLLMETLKEYQSFTGVDIYQKRLNQAIRKFKRNSVEFLNMNAENLEFEDDSFDLASISESLHHLKNPVKVLTEIRRVLKKSGFFILQESFSDPDQPEPRISDVLIHEYIAKVDVSSSDYHHGFYSRQEMVKMVEEAGFSNNEARISHSPLKCVLCKYADHCSDSKSKKMINTGLRAISASLKKARGLSEYDDLKTEATGIRKKVRENGYSPASVIFIFAIK